MKSLLLGLSVALPLGAGCGGGKNLPSWEELPKGPPSPPQTMYATGPDGAPPPGGGSSLDDGGSSDDPGDPGDPGYGGNNGGATYDAAGTPSPQGRPRVCLELSTCCSQPKACDREIFACQGVAMIGDATLCETVLNFYEAVGCDNKLNIGAQVLTGFAGCIPKPGGGFY